MGYSTEIIGKLKSNKQFDHKTISTINSLQKHQTDPHFKGEILESEKPNSSSIWEVDDDENHIRQKEIGKSYYYIEWLEYIIKNILKPKGYSLSGELIAEGEAEDDISRVIVKNGRIAHKSLSKKQISEYRLKRNEKSKKIAGNILIQAKANSKTVSHRSFFSLRELFLKKMFNSHYNSVVALVKERDNTINLYDVSYDQTIDKEIDAYTLVSHKNMAISISHIAKIVHLNSPLFRCFLCSKNVFQIIIQHQKSVPQNYIFKFKNNEIIQKIKSEMIQNNLHFTFESANDFNFYKIFLAKFVGGIIIGLLTYLYLNFIFLFSLGLLESQSLIYVLVMVISTFVYYHIVIKRFLKLFYYVFWEDLIK